MRVLVIGGAGFIGTKISYKLIQQGHAVTIYDKKELSSYFSSLGDSCQYIQGDIRNLENLVRACDGNEVVYNLAAEHADNVQPLNLYDEVNVLGAENVCLASKLTGIKRNIFTSSVAVYGMYNSMLDEMSDHNYFNDYGRTKHLAEKAYYNWLNESDDHRLTIIRPTVVFGPGNRGNVYNLLKQIKSGKFIMIGSGKNIKSIAHVENVSSFLIYLLNKDERSGIYNYADKPDFNMNELLSFIYATLEITSPVNFSLPQSIGLFVGKSADLISSVLRISFPISEVRIKKFCSNSIIDSRKALSSGFVPEVSLENALKDMIINHV